MIIPCFIMLTLAGPFGGNKQVMVNTNSLDIGGPSALGHTEIKVRGKQYTVKETPAKINELARKECQ